MGKENDSDDYLERRYEQCVTIAQNEYSRSIKRGKYRE